MLPERGLLSAGLPSTRMDHTAPLSGVCSEREASALFASTGFVGVRQYVRKYHCSSLGRVLPDGTAEFIGRLWGWHRWVETSKLDPGRDLGACRSLTTNAGWQRSLLGA